MCVLLWCVFTAACVLGEGVEMFSWLDGHSFILLYYSKNQRMYIFSFDKANTDRRAIQGGIMEKTTNNNRNKSLKNAHSCKTLKLG